MEHKSKGIHNYNVIPKSKASIRESVNKEDLFFACGLTPLQGTQSAYFMTC